MHTQCVQIQFAEQDTARIEPIERQFTFLLNLDQRGAEDLFMLLNGFEAGGDEYANRVPPYENPQLMDFTVLLGSFLGDAQHAKALLYKAGCMCFPMAERKKALALAQAIGRTLPKQEQPSGLFNDDAFFTPMSKEWQSELPASELARLDVAAKEHGLFCPCGECEQEGGAK